MAAISSFADIAHLSDAQIKDLLGKVDQKDITRAVKGEGVSAVKGKLFANMSPRVRTFMEEFDAISQGVPKEEIKAAQDHIVDVAKRLR